MPAIGYPRGFAGGLAVAVSLFALASASPALARQQPESCADVAASRWEAGHADTAREFEGSDMAQVIASCEPALVATPADDAVKAWLGHAYVRAGRTAEGVKLLTEAAEAGNAVAQFVLAGLYREGTGLAADAGQSLAILTASAAQGFAPAQLALGDAYRWGDTIVDQDLARARTLYEQADAAGALAATDALGHFYLEGLGGAKDLERALEYASRAAEAGYPDSQNRVGYIHAEGIGVPRDSAVALEWFRKAAAQGHELATRNVAELEAEIACAAAAASPYEPDFQTVGRAFEAIDPATAIPPCEDAVARDPGSDEDKAWLARAYLAADRIDDALPLLETAAAGDSTLGQFLLGQVLNGDFGGDSVDVERANQQFRAAAEAGYAPAQLSLGYAYDIGNGIGMDDAAAAEWYRKAAEQGLPRAQASLGYLYHGGNGVPLDYEQALHWYSLAADQDDIVGIYGVGQLYEFGQGVTQDYARAFEYFQRGADLGDAYAQGDLGYLYDVGQGVDADPQQAAYWYGRAADQGYALAQANLAQLYTSGRGVPQDFARALELYTSAHEQGEVSGTVGIAQAYLYGEGVAYDYGQARNYAQQAADSGSVYGMGTLGYLYSEGLGVPRDFDRAIALFDQAAAQDDQYGIDRAAEARAERDCGLAAAASYENGYETTGRTADEIDPASAVPVCEEAVRLDAASLENKNWLARAYLAAGRSDEALDQFEAAVAGGWNPALVGLADMLQWGMAVPSDPARAYSLYSEAAGRGFAPAELGLGLSYQLGQGVPADPDTAEKWFRRALNHGYATAQDNLDHLAAQRATPITGPQRAMPRG